MRSVPLLLLLLSGCIPFTFVRSPGASGIIIDSSTGQPLADAEVFMSHATFKPPRTVDPASGKETYINGATTEQFTPPSMYEALRLYRAPVIVTGPEGGFSIPPQRAGDFWFPASNVIGSFGTLVIRREGYVEEMRFIESYRP